jgi:uncharacterized protein
VKEAAAVQTHYAVKEIPPSGIIIKDEFSSDWVNFVLGSTLKSQQKPAKVEFTLIRQENNVLLDGCAEIAFKFNCSRCAEEGSVELKTNLNCTFVKDVEEEVEGYIGTAGLNSECDVVNYTDTTIDLEQALVEQIVLALPAHPLCHKQCKGLCDQCGQNLNLGNCSCQGNQSDPRWAKLKEINLGD